MNKAKLVQLLNKKFPFETTSQQSEVINQLSEFVENSSANSLFLLKGYAGTGKTTLVSSLINSLWMKLCQRKQICDYFIVKNEDISLLIYI